MQKYLPFLTIALVVVMLALFFPMADTLELVLQAIAVFLAIMLTIASFQGTDGSAASGNPGVAAEKPEASPSVRGSAEAEVIAFLARLQDKGRLIDFLMDDISGHDDAAIGAAARVVHQGCKPVLQEHLEIEPVEKGEEGSSIQVPADYDASLYQLTGSVDGDGPFSGTLVHKGWKVTSAKLPKVVTDGKNLPPLAQASVEV